MRSFRRAVFASLLAVVAVSAAAATSPSDHPFAKHFLALQLSQKEPARQALVLSVANNMLKQFGPDSIVIEVVTFGPGIRLLYADNPLRKRVESLVEQGVRFDVCENTLNSVKDKTGKMPTLDPHVVKVPAGVARLMELHDQGYTLVRP